MINEKEKALLEDKKFVERLKKNRQTTNARISNLEQEVVNLGLRVEVLTLKLEKLLKE